MDPEVWGPHVWNWLHDLASRWDSTPSSTSSITDVLDKLQHVLPCYMCREHYAHMILHFKPLIGTMPLQRIVYNMHDMVNRRLHKPPSPTYEQVVRQYKDNQRDQADNVLCDALFYIKEYYNDSDIDKKYTRHRAFIDAVGRVYTEMGYVHIGQRMEDACANRSGSKLIRRASGGRRSLSRPRSSRSRHRRRGSSASASARGRSRSRRRWSMKRRTGARPRPSTQRRG